MHADDPGCPRRNEPLYLGRIDIVRHWIHVAKHGRYLLPLQGMGRGDKGVAGNDHLAFEAKSAARDFYGCRGVAHGNCMFDSEKVGYFALKLLHYWPVVRQPSTIQNLVDSLEESLPVSQVWAAHMQVFRGIHLAGECGPPEPFFSKIISAVKHVDLTV